MIRFRFILVLVYGWEVKFWIVFLVFVVVVCGGKDNGNWGVLISGCGICLLLLGFGSGIMCVFVEIIL